ncbi:hypothetical protein K1T73_10360 [Roseovarius sp. SCSIO 43702]|uniref:hypothetical protein n=1 Tax=Roseovarius sp. SCSIO 43702 TaxID=2823043 RepID=UPI001C729E08|nr:hypothetical protein [Roseovarius sp. SCSIO 43702]QYX55504.1 hypothetical protein K1T73_10360 [Roseovarius sp. SCSIO 43702]
MDFVAAQSKVGGGGGNLVAIPNEVRSRTALPDLPPLLRGVVFIGQPHLGAGGGRQVAGQLK